MSYVNLCIVKQQEYKVLKGFKSRPLSVSHFKSKHQQNFRITIDNILLNDDFKSPLNSVSTAKSAQFILSQRSEKPSIRKQSEQIVLPEGYESKDSNKDVMSHLRLQTPKRRLVTEHPRIKSSTTRAFFTSSSQIQTNLTDRVSPKKQVRTQETLPRESAKQIQRRNTESSKKIVGFESIESPKEIVGFKQGGLDEASKVEKLIQMDPMELKKVYDELALSMKTLEKLDKDADKFFSELFDQQQDDYLKVNKSVLSEIELSFVIDQFKLKQDLLERRLPFDRMDFDALDKLLQRLGFFERFTRSTRINIFKLAFYMEVPPGEYVFHQGDYGDNLFVILQGSVNVKIYKQFQHDGTVFEQVVSSLFDGQHFGELAMLETKQKEEEVLLEEKLQDINVKSLEEVKKQLFKEDMHKLEVQSKMLRNIKLMELNQQGSDRVKWLEEEPEEVKQYAVELVNEEKGTNNLQNGKPAPSTFSYTRQAKQQQRTASIQASETCHLLAIGRENFKNILMVLMQEELELKIKMLKSLRFFNEVQPFVLIPLANQLVQEVFSMDQIITRQGDPISTMYIIYKGSCNVSSNFILFLKKINQKVIRTITTRRRKIPMNESKGSMKGSPSFIFGSSVIVKDDLRKFKTNDNYIQKYDNGKITEFTITHQDSEHIYYERSYIYKKYDPGEILFGRAITGLTLEGAVGEDRARMTVVSSSNKTVLYSINQRLLAFCPEFLKEHLVNFLLTQKEIDKLPVQPINQELKKLEGLLAKPKNVSHYERRQLNAEAQKDKESKLQEKQLRANLDKPQNELKQDIRNKDWERFKSKLVYDSLKLNVLEYKKY